MPSKVFTEPQRFVRDIIWVAISQAITSALGIITLPALTKSYTTESYGIWAQINVTVGLVVPLLTLQFGSAVVRFLAGEKDKTKRRRSLGAMFYTILIFSIVLFVAINIFSAQLSNFLFDNPAYIHFVRLTFLWASVDAVFTFFISYLRAMGQIKTLAGIQVGFSIARMILIIGMASHSFGLDRIIIWIILVDLLFAVGVIFLVVRKEGFPTPNLIGIKTFLVFSIPQVPVVLLGWILSSSDRYFITHFLNLSQVGIYSSTVLLSGIISMLFYPINFVLLPTVSKAWEQNQKDDVKSYFEYSTKVLLTLAVPAVIGLAMLSQPVLKIATTSEYMAGWQLILLLSTGCIFNGLSQINVYIIYLVKKTTRLLLLALITSTISVGINYLLIPKIGIIGAAISNITAYFIAASIMFIWARQFVSYSINFRYLVKVVIATLPMALFLYYLKVDGILGIILAVIGGIAIFSLGMFLLRAFSERDKRLTKQTLTGLFKW
jgi:O-antigen/teichoic acid export membrane protein